MHFSSNGCINKSQNIQLLGHSWLFGTSEYVSSENVKDEIMLSGLVNLMPINHLEPNNNKILFQSVNKLVNVSLQVLACLI